MSHFKVHESSEEKMCPILKGESSKEKESDCGPYECICKCEDFDHF